MQALTRLFTEHPGSVEETYFEHMRFALSFAGLLCLAAGAALEAVYVCHQAFGAVGITLEGPAFRVARRVRQLVSEPPIEPPAREAVLELFGV